MPKNLKPLSTDPRNVKRRAKYAASREAKRLAREAEMRACDARTMEKWEASGRRAARGFMFFDSIEVPMQHSYTIKDRPDALEP